MFLACVDDLLVGYAIRPPGRQPPSPRPGGSVAISPRSAAGASYVRHRIGTGRFPHPGAAGRLRLMTSAIRPRRRGVSSAPDAPLVSSPSCRLTAHPRHRSISSFTRTLLVLSQTYSMMGIVSSARPSSTAFAVPAKVFQSTFPAPFTLTVERVAGLLTRVRAKAL